MRDCDTCRSWSQRNRSVGWCILLRRFTLLGVEHTRGEGCYHTQRNPLAEKLERAIVTSLRKRVKKKDEAVIDDNR